MAKDFPEITLKLARRLREIRDNKGFVEGQIIKLPDLKDREKLLAFIEAHPELNGDQIALSVLDYKREKREDFVLFV